jgi:hypothetical protein
MQIGITLSLTQEHESLWVNGIKLNVLNLIKTLQQIGGHDVYIMETGSVVQDLTKVMWDYKKYPIHKWADKINEVDLIFMLGTSLPSKTILDIKTKRPGVKVVKYQCGNNYVVDMERVIFDTAGAALPSWDIGHDETWMIPQQEYQNAEYFKLIYRHKDHQIKTVPFVWDPEHLQNSANVLRAAGKKSPGYQAKDRSEKKISIMEPNLNVVKWSMIPIMIAEKMHREFGEGAFKQIYVGSGQRILDSPYYKQMIKTFDIVRHTPPLIKYIGRYPAAVFFAEETDIVISHQWENPLNYAYLDAMHFGYPLVHNADMIKDAGYYYEGFNVGEGYNQLKEAIENHDQNIEAQKKKNQKVLNRYLTTNPKVVDTYRKLIENLFEPGKHSLSYKYDWKTNTYK